MMHVVFGTVIYPKALCYAEDFFGSLKQQTFKQFELIIIAEGINAYKTKEWCSRFPNTFIFREPNGNPVHENRIRILKEAKSRHCDLLILGDCDDRFSSNRVEKLVKGFDNEYAFFYNDLLDFSSNPVFPTLPKVTTREDLINKNYLGLSNTAINLKKLDDNFIDSLKLGATSCFDWYLFSRILDNGEKGKFIEGASTFYRIHDENMAGIASLIDLRKELTVKTEHYELMSKTNPEYLNYLKTCLRYADNLESMKDNFRREQKSSDLEFWWNNVSVL